MAIDQTRVNWILDADIKGFFDSLSQDWLMRFLEHRVGDARVLRLVRKWLKAGVLDQGQWSLSETGTPQGAVISPLLANVYLHYAFDLWAQQWQRREARGHMVVVRYADDIVVGFERKADADRFWRAMARRLARFALELHSTKTRLLPFGRHASAFCSSNGRGRAPTFDFLGFTHICGRTRRGGFLLLRHTRADRLRAKLKDIKVELRRCWHASIADQGRWLRRAVNGYFNYHAVPTNSHALRAFRYQVTKLWRRALCRRSQRGRVTWVRMHRIAEHWLPPARILHPWPSRRPAVTHPR